MQLYKVCKCSAKEKVLECVARVKFFIFVAGWLSMTKYNPQNLPTINYSICRIFSFKYFELNQCSLQVCLEWLLPLGLLELPLGI